MIFQLLLIIVLVTAGLRLTLIGLFLRDNNLLGDYIAWGLGIISLTLAAWLTTEWIV